MQLLSLLLLLHLALAHAQQPAACRVAVVGAGIGGSAAAYYARELLEDDEGCSITVFEGSIRVGGRVENVSYDGKPLEIGASILYSKNLHLMNAIAALGLHAGPPVWDANSSSSGADATMGIWDDQAGRLVFRSSEWDLLTALRVLWRYGPVRMWRLRRLVADTLAKFMVIYELQGSGGGDSGKAGPSSSSSCPTGFATPEALWEAVGLYGLTRISLREYLAEQRVGGPDCNIVKEFVGSVNRVNYNQNNDLNSLAGLVSLCPTVTGAVVSVREGNARMAEAMLQAAQANLRPNVSVGAIRIVRDGDGGNSPSVYRLEGTDGAALGEFDAVVVATPFALSNIRIIGPDGNDVDVADNGGGPSTAYPPADYQTTHATFVEGSVRPGYFGPGTGGKRGTPGSVYVAENCTTTLSSLALHVRVNATHGVYKLFSRGALNAAFLDGLFSSWAVLHHRDWRAYPHFHPPEAMCPFVLVPFERVFYTNALETAVSAMEISAIAARNAAILLAQSLGKGRWSPLGQCGAQGGEGNGVVAEL